MAERMGIGNEKINTSSSIGPSLAFLNSFVTFVSFVVSHLGSDLEVASEF